METEKKTRGPSRKPEDRIAEFEQKIKDIRAREAKRSLKEDDPAFSYLYGLRSTLRRGRKNELMDADQDHFPIPENIHNAICGCLDLVESYIEEKTKEVGIESEGVYEDAEQYE